MLNSSAMAIHNLFEKIIPFAQFRVGQVWRDNQKMQEICENLVTAKKDFDKEPMIMIVGAFSSGKSTLMNNLLGEEKCETGILPTTKDLQEEKWQGRLLVDSCGLDAWNQPENEKKAMEAARRSNRAVLVLHARQPLRASEVPILKELVRAKSEITVAINYWNHVETEEDRSKVKHFVRDCLREYMPDRHVEPVVTEEDRSECRENVHGCLKENMPDNSVKVFPINAKSRNDPGVQKLSRFLRSTDDGAQKLVSAEAAVQNAVQQMLEMCNMFEAKEEKEHEKKMQMLLSEIESLEKERDPKKQLLRRDQKALQSEEQELKKMDSQLTELPGLWATGSHAVGGACLGWCVGWPVAVAGAVGGGIVGSIRNSQAQPRRLELQSQKKASEERIKELRTEVQMREDTEADLKTKYEAKSLEIKQESDAFEKMRVGLAADKSQLEDFAKEHPAKRRRIS